MAEKLGFGLLGSGLVAPFHATSIQKSNGGTLVAVCDVDRGRADTLAAKYGVQAYHRLEDMLKDPRIQVVNVLTPNHLHYDAVMRCVAARRHVITEKPPAMSLRETDEMIVACEKAGLKFACTVQCRVRKAIQAIKGAVASGRFGKLLHADTYMKWFRATEYYQSDPWRSSRQSGAGVTVQHAFHCIDLLQYLAGPVARVEARMSNLSHPTVRLEDTLLAFIHYANGAQGVVQASTALWPGTDIRIEINGTDGTGIVVGERMATWKFRDERPEDGQVRALGSAAQATGAGGAADFGYQDHAVVIQDFIDAVREGRDVVIPVRSVRPTVELVLAMYQSAARQAPVQLPIKDDPSIWEGA
jgi:UDP-N-acetyl-2-amino-2-deoxyglucuronate dehydrogenase